MLHSLLLKTLRNSTTNQAAILDKDGTLLKAARFKNGKKE